MNINDKLQKKLHLISFVVTALVIGYFAFVAVQLLAVHFLGVHTIDAQPDNSGFYGHNYCGTFFIDITRDNSFADEASYLAALQHTATPVKDILLNTAAVVMVLSLLIFLRRADKQTMHKKRTAWLLLLSGGLYALGNTVVETTNLSPQTDGFKGVMATQSYYPQLYAVYGIPLLVIAYGLILLHYEQATRQNVVGTRVALKACAWVTGISAFGFMLWRFGVRCYELFSSANARLPFYSVLLDLPRPEAVSETAYTKLLLLRFVKDLPVFAASAIGVIVLIKLLLSAANGQINTTENRRRLKLASLTLTVSSVIFNLLGLAEVNMLNNGFTGIYGNATYTIGIRSGCEPMLYAFILIAIEIYIQAIPQTEQ